MCFANDNGQCAALNIGRCTHNTDKPCAFYKTSEQYEADRERAEERAIEMGYINGRKIG